MLDTPQIIQTTAETAAVIHLTVSRGDMMRSLALLAEN
jgi:hypothetical protein